ncbi:MAG: hypothetical protein FWE77_05575 [Clostridia bacterium]|nr:hypothetical protein [Clostridia bacterium]
MDYTDEILQRANVRQIRAFLLHGVEDLETDTRPPAQRLKEESRPIYARLEALYPDGDALDEALYDLSRALAAYAATYLELGIIAGARLARQMLG